MELVSDVKILTSSAMMVNVHESQMTAGLSISMKAYALSALKAQ